MVYQVGERVLYGVHGVCQVVELQKQTINRKTVEYYVLEPVTQQGTRYFVPSQNEKAVAKMRPVLTKPQVDALLNDVSTADIPWIDDENERKRCYMELITAGDRLALLGVVRTLRRHRQLQMQDGKKFHVNDAVILKDAEKLLFGELSAVLSVPYEQVESYIEFDK